MNRKGIETRKLIIENACMLFEEKGFKDVTMKDICEAAGLSRGGLYCHYESTEQIFLEILSSFLSSQNNALETKIQSNISAVKILNEILEKYRLEMLDAGKSLSLAINEYFSNKNYEEDNILALQYKASFQSWNMLINYGISRGEFKKADVNAIFDLIAFSYQGVRMYSRLMPINAEIPERIINQIKVLLIAEERCFNE